MVDWSIESHLGAFQDSVHIILGKRRKVKAKRIITIKQGEPAHKGDCDEKNKSLEKVSN